MTVPKRPREDDASRAVRIMKTLTGEIEPDVPSDAGKNPAAQELGRRGGAARAKAMTPEQRSEAARQAAAKRWKGV